MEHRPTEQDGNEALREHIAVKAHEARLRYGLYIDAETMYRILDDRKVCRFPVGVRFDTEQLEPGEPAYPMPLGERPTEGFCLFVHPVFEDQPDLIPLIVAYYIAAMNYGEIVTREEAELFGATLLGLEIDTYYQAMCEIADSLPSATPSAGDREA
jgi:hypothetical protein